MLQKKYSVYCFTNKINNKKYIGSTIVSPDKRYSQHLYVAFHENAHQYNYPLYQAIRKYGIKNFTFEIITQKDCSEEEIRQIEYEYIVKFDSLAPNGYNQTLNTCHPLNDSKSYEKMSNTKREKNKRVAEVDNNNKIINIWRSISDCAEDLQINRNHIADCCRGERRSAGGKFFYWLDENDTLIINEYTGPIYKGEKGSTQIQSSSKKVYKIELKTGKILSSYDTIALAARENSCDPSGIAKVCKNIRKSCGGYKWIYADE